MTAWRSLPILVLAASLHAADAPPPAPSAQAQPIAASRKPLADHGLQPLVDKARETYPAARKTFAAGLPRGDKFFVRVQLEDATGATDYAVLRVRTIIDGVIKGNIYSAPKKVAGFQFGQPCDVPEGEILDWIIARADGGEEGDLMAKILGKPAP